MKGMVLDPTSNALLLLYDDSQSIYERSRTKQFSFQSVGIQARGRTTKLRVNYRNTKQILQIASKIARDILSHEDRDEDNIPILKPISCGREGEEPRIFRVNDFEEEVRKIADLLKAAHIEGHPWGDMAILCRSHKQLELCANKLQFHGIPLETAQSCHPASGGAVRLITMQASKGLEFAVVALAGIGLMPRPDLDEKDEAKLFYVAATRATHKLFITISGEGAFGKLLTDNAA
jgi:superfamily I DNA/RNA helicase